MPYIAPEDRPRLDAAVDALAVELASKLSKEMNGDTEVSLCYKEAFLAVARRLGGLQRGGKQTARSKAEELAFEVFTGAEKHGYRGAWAGALDYALTRLIQCVPLEMVEKRVWKEEFRFWVYVQTAGALERTAMKIHAEGGNDDWVTDALVGVLTDVKDEYKRRVNSAYEAIQIRKSGDCYTTPYRTQVVDVKDDVNKVIGYTEVMKEFGDQSKRTGKVTNRSLRADRGARAR
jgi:hypothetical protein